MNSSEADEHRPPLTAALLTPEGRVLRVLRETLAEIEVPVQLSRR